MIKKKLDLPHKIAERSEDEVARASLPVLNMAGTAMIQASHPILRIVAGVFFRNVAKNDREAILYIDR